MMISPVAFGSGQVGGLMINGDDATRLAALRRAIDGGINWVDTAPQYGDGKSETAVGWALRELGADLHVSTKIRLTDADIRSRQACADAVIRSVETSLRRLGRSRLDVLQLHNRLGPELRDGVVTPEFVTGELAAILHDVRSRGLVRHIGMTALGDTAACRTVMQSGLFDTAQVYYNMLNPSAGQKMPAAWRGQDFGELLHVAADQDMGVFAIRIFAAGALATGGESSVPSDITTDSKPDIERRRAAGLIAALPERLRDSPAATAIRFVLAHPAVSTAVVGVGAVDHVNVALTAVAAPPLTAEDIDAIQNHYRTGLVT